MAETTNQSASGMSAPALLRSLRPHQWSKNALLAVPLITGHAWADAGRLVSLAIAFAAYCLAASSAYLVNDVLDREHDRAHPTKRRRPVAAGELSVAAALATAAVMIVAAGALAWWVGTWFAIVLAGYVVTTAAYSTYLKRKTVVDVIVLAGLYTLRIIAGGIAVDLFPTAWLLGFSAFVFLSLALAKRYAELHDAEQRNELTIAGRGYLPGDLPLLANAGISSGYIAVVVLALFISRPSTAQHYLTPALLWLILPMLIFWLTRFWLLVVRGSMTRDPVLFTLIDRASWVVVVATLAIIVVAAQFDLSGLLPS